MKRSLRIEFVDGDRISLDTQKEVQNEQSMIRSLVLNLVSAQGQDLIFPDRGTSFGWGDFGNVILTAANAGGTAKFAAADTLFFTREVSRVDPEDKPEELQLLPISITTNSLEMQLSCETVDGRTLSYTF